MEISLNARALVPPSMVSKEPLAWHGAEGHGEVGTCVENGWILPGRPSQSGRRLRESQQTRGNIEAKDSTREQVYDA